jgi:hypothetical protein
VVIRETTDGVFVAKRKAQKGPFEWLVRVGQEEGVLHLIVENALEGTKLVLEAVEQASCKLVASSRLLL